MAVPVMVLVSVLTVSSCVDTSAIAQFAKSSQDVGNNFKSIADATVATCQRAHDFFPPGKQPLNCGVYEAIEPKLIAVNDVLFAYIASLGRLAAPISNTNPFGNIGSELYSADSSITTEEQNKANAAGGLFGALAQVALSGYQQRRLTEIMRASAGDVGSVVDFLSGYAANRSRQMINNTWTLENEFCVGQPQVLGGEPLAIKILKIKCDEDSTRKDAKLNAIDSYQAALGVIKATHSKLSSTKNWTTKDLVNYLVPQITQLTVASLAMRSAFQ